MCFAEGILYKREGGALGKINLAHQGDQCGGSSSFVCLMSSVFNQEFNVHVSNDAGSGRLYVLYNMLHCMHTLLNI